MPDLSVQPTCSAVRNENNARAIVDNIKTLGLERGAVIPWAMLYEWLGFRDRPRLYPIVARANQMLQVERGWFLDNERKVGYRIALPGKEIDLVMGVRNQGIRKFRKAIIMGNNIRLSELTDIDRSRTIEENQKTALLYGKVGMIT